MTSILARITVAPDRVINPGLIGVGYHVLGPLRVTDGPGDFHDRWQAMRPGFARLALPRLDQPDRLEPLAETLAQLKATGTQVYLTTFSPENVPAGPERDAYLSRVADQLQHLVRDRDADHIRYYCISNELSLDGWGMMIHDMANFADYHRRLHAELRRRGLEIALLAPDASPVARWQSVDWCLQHMDDVTQAYGVHHYFNDHPPDDPALYPWFGDLCAKLAQKVKPRGKPLIIGEFGAGQNLGHRLPEGGGRWDGCRWWDTPQEAMVGVQLADAVAAMLNAGVDAMALWTFVDGADPGPDRRYWNKWGLYRNSGDEFSPRPHALIYAPMSHLLRSPAQVVHSASDDRLVHVAATRDPSAGGAAVLLVINHHDHPVSLHIDPGDPASGTWQRWLYDPATAPSQLQRDPLQPTDHLDAPAGPLEDHLPPRSVALYRQPPRG